MPDDWKAHVEHGTALESAGEIGPAADAYAAAHRLHPHTETDYFLAGALRRQGHPEAALACLSSGF